MEEDRVQEHLIFYINEFYAIKNVTMDLFLLFRKNAGSGSGSALNQCGSETLSLGGDSGGPVERCELASLITWV